MREWPYTASNRDVLGCTSPLTSRFPSAFGLRPQDISRASGNLLVVGDVQPNTSLLSAVYGYNTSQLEAVYSHSLIINPSLGMNHEIYRYRASIWKVFVSVVLRFRLHVVAHWARNIVFAPKLVEAVKEVIVVVVILRGCKILYKGSKEIYIK